MSWGRLMPDNLKASILSPEELGGVVDQLDPNAIGGQGAEAMSLTSPMPEQPGVISGAIGSTIDELQGVGEGALAYGADAIGATNVRDALLRSAYENFQQAQQQTPPEADIDYLTSGQASLGDIAKTAEFYAIKGIVNLASGGIAGMVGKKLATAAVKKQIENAVRRKVEEHLLSKNIPLGPAGVERIAKTATDKALAKVGSAGFYGGIGAHAFGSELGDTYTQAVDQAGGNPDAVDRGRVLGYSALATIPEFASEAVGLGLARVAPGIRDVGKSLLGRGNAVSRAAKGAVLGAAVEGPTEGLQAYLEDVGAGQDPNSPAVQKDILQSALAGAIGGAAIGHANILNRYTPPEQGDSNMPPPSVGQGAQSTEVPQLPSPPKALPAPAPVAETSADSTDLFSKTTNRALDLSYLKPDKQAPAQTGVIYPASPEQVGPPAPVITPDTGMTHEEAVARALDKVRTQGIHALAPHEEQLLESDLASQSPVQTQQLIDTSQVRPERPEFQLSRHNVHMMETDLGSPKPPAPPLELTPENTSQLQLDLQVPQEPVQVQEVPQSQLPLDETVIGRPSPEGQIAESPESAVRRGFLSAYAKRNPKTNRVSKGAGPKLYLKHVAPLLAEADGDPARMVQVLNSLEENPPVKTDTFDSAIAQARGALENLYPTEPGFPLAPKRKPVRKRAAKKKVATKKTAAKKATTKKAPAKKAVTKKVAAKKTAAETKVAAKKAPTKKAVTKKVAAKKTVVVAEAAPIKETAAVTKAASTKKTAAVTKAAPTKKAAAKKSSFPKGISHEVIPEKMPAKPAENASEDYHEVHSAILALAKHAADLKTNRAEAVKNLTLDYDYLEEMANDSTVEESARKLAKSALEKKPKSFKPTRVFYSKETISSSPNPTTTKFSRARKVGRKGMTVSEVRKALGSRYKSLVRKGVPIHIVQSNGDLAQHNEDVFAEVVNSDEPISGVYHDGHIYLIADNLYSEQHAAATLFDHELRHLGLSKMFGPTMDEFLDQVWSGRLRSEVENFGRRIGVDTTTLQGRREATEEYIVHLAETGQRNSLLKKAYAIIRDFLRRIGIDLEFTELDLREIVAQAGTLAESRKKAAMSGAVRASRTYASKRPKWYSLMRRVIDEKMPEEVPLNQARKSIRSWLAEGRFKQEEYLYSEIETFFNDYEKANGKDATISRQVIQDYLASQDPEIVAEVRGLEKHPETLHFMMSHYVHEELVKNNPYVIKKNDETGEYEIFERLDDSFSNPVMSEPDMESAEESVDNLLWEMADDIARGRVDSGFIPDEIRQKHGITSYPNLSLSSEHSTRGVPLVILKTQQPILQDYGIKIDQLGRERQRESHFPAAKNQLVFYRMEFAKTEDGKNVLFINEIQSDMFQKGRWVSESYLMRQQRVKYQLEQALEKAKTKSDKKALQAALRAVTEDISNKRNRLSLKPESEEGMMDKAPFQQSWLTLPIKHLLMQLSDPEQVFTQNSLFDAETMRSIDYIAWPGSAEMVQKIETGVPAPAIAERYTKHLPRQVGRLAKQLGTEVTKIRLAGVSPLKIEYTDTSSERPGGIGKTKTIDVSEAFAVPVTDEVLKTVSRGMPKFSRANVGFMEQVYADRSAPNTVGKVIRSVRNALTNLGDFSRQQRAHWMTDDQLEWEFGESVPELKKLVASLNNMSRLQTDIVLKARPVLESMMALSDKSEKRAQQLFKLMAETTIYRIDPRPGADNAHVHKRHRQHIARLQREYNSLGKDAQKIYNDALEVSEYLYDLRKLSLERKIRHTYMRRIRELKESGAASRAAILKSEMEREIKELDSTLPKLKGPYFPLIRSGKWVVVADSKEFSETSAELKKIAKSLMSESISDKTREKLKERRKQLRGKLEYLRAEPRHHHVEHVASKAAAEELRAQLESKGFDNLQVFLKPDYEREVATVNSAFLKKLESQVESADPSIRNALRDIITRTYVESMPERSAVKAQLRRIGVAGYERDMMRAFAAAVQRDSHHISRLTHFDDIYRSLQTLADSRDYDSTIIYNTMSKRLAASLRLVETPWQNFMSNLNFLHFLGSPAFILQNLTQTHMIAHPLLAGRYGWNRSRREIGKAMRDATGIIKHAFKTDKFNRGLLHFEVDFDNLPSNISTDEERMLKWLLSRNLIDITIEHDMAAVAKGALSSKGGKAFQKAMEMAMWAPHHVEVFNRVSTALAAYRLGKASGKFKSEESLRESVRQYLSKSQLNYTAENRPLFMRIGVVPGARLLFQFRMYQQGMLYLLASEGNKAFRGGTAEERRAARSALFYIAAHHMAMTGMLGLPVTGPILATLSLMAKAWPDDDEPDPEVALRNFLAHTFGKDMGLALSKGLPALFGVDVHQKIGMGDVFSLVRFYPQESARDTAKEVIVNALGPTAGRILDVSGALFDDMAEGNVLRGLEKLMPVRLLSDMARIARYQTQGVETKYGTQLMMPSDITYLSLMFQGLGLTPTQMSELYEGRQAVNSKIRAVEKERARILRRINQARIAKDRKAEMKYRAEAAAFNRRHPQKAFRISGNVMAKSYRAYRKLNRSIDRDTGVKLDKKSKIYKHLADFSMAR